MQREQSHHPREFADFVYTYPVVSRRSGGVSIGVNLNLDKFCNFDCPYCQVDRTVPKPRQAISVPAIRTELEKLLAAFDADGICRLERFAAIPDADKRLKDIAVSGDGEPTMVPEFADVCGMLADLQSSRPEPDFRLILITNSTLLDRPNVLEGISRLLSRNGEVWAKLDAGTEAWYQKVNVSRVSLDRIEANLIRLGQDHPFKVQSLFCGLDGVTPPPAERDAYLDRLRRIKASGGRILEVQLHTLARKPAQASCTPVTGGFLRDLRDRIESGIGAPARVYGAET
ncbi:MAG TPA: radical SAM protein [Fibrobacteria bacterium]|nr:radical SAM protein [Fibrobacteria bacterium]